MSNLKNRSRDDNIREMRRLQEMYRRLPPEKQKAARAHMQGRLDQLQAAIDGRSGGGRKSAGMGMAQTILLVLLAAVVALGAGFFGVAFLAQ